jgi:uncharacterized protein (DUF885 family)
MASVRSVFDQMPRTDAAAWSNIAARLNKIPEALASYRRTLDEGIARGMTVARRQVKECARQAGAWSGSGGQPSFFSAIGDDFSRSDIDDAALREGIERGVAAADEAYGGLRRYLLETYLPRAVDVMAAAARRISLRAALQRRDPEPGETYAWAWDELNRSATCRATAPHRAGRQRGGRAAPARHRPGARHRGADAYRAWLREVHDDALDKVDAHFDVDPHRTIE